MFHGLPHFRSGGEAVLQDSGENVIGIARVITERLSFVRIRHMARHPSDPLLRLARNAEEPRRDSDNANVEYCPSLGTLDNLDYIRIPIMLGTENHLPAGTDNLDC